ncbi:macro domain-containing protein [Nonomuraea sp. NPDC048901]|uniref:macro domain-containing protein n=1 Tax=Nonomuraea sp. NPDC048901 TaxID=3155627 RepID=UPI0033F14F2C
MITYLTGDATDPAGNEPRIICHICNDVGGWGRGFVLAVSRRWPEPEAEFRAWHRSGTGFELGQVQLVQVEESLWVANMIGQHGIRPTKEGPPIRYDTVDRSLEAVAIKAIELGASLHMPRIGCGLAGGTWDRIEPLITHRLVTKGIPVTVYDLE